jgi:hypothetical protein
LPAIAARFSATWLKLDRYFHQQVTQDTHRRVTNCFVVIAEEMIAGYYTLAADADRDRVSRARAGKHHGSITVALLPSLSGLRTFNPGALVPTAELLLRDAPEIAAFEE